MINRAGTVGLLLAILLAACGGEETEQAGQNGSLTVTDGWARETSRDQIAGVAYFVIENGGPVDRLVGFETSIADRAMLHLSETVDGVSRMHPMAALAIPSGVPVILAPGGLHVMMVGLTGQLHIGDRFELVLIFESAGRVPVEIEVQAGDTWHFGRAEEPEPELDAEGNGGDDPE